MTTKDSDGKTNKTEKRERRFPLTPHDELGPKEGGPILRHRTKRPDGKFWVGTQEQLILNPKTRKAYAASVQSEPYNRFYVDHFIEDETHLLPHLLGEDCIATELHDAVKKSGRDCGVSVYVVKDAPRQKSTVDHHTVRYAFHDEHGIRRQKNTLPDRDIMRVLIDEEQVESLHKLYRLAPVLEAVVKVTLNLMEHRNRVLDAAQKAIDGIVDLMNDSLQRHPEIADIVQAHAKIMEMAKKKTEGAEIIDNAVLVLDEYTKFLCANTRAYAQAYGPYGRHRSLTLVRTSRRVTWIITGFEWRYTFFDKYRLRFGKDNKVNPRSHLGTFLSKKKILHAPGNKDLIIGHIEAPKRVNRTFLRADADLARNDTNYRETQRHVDDYLAIAEPFSDTCQRPPIWRHFRVGIMAPSQGRCNGATPGSA
ncbi:hypothetical protein [Candidatus Igneacidithiobacillus taiwanensis]|uniref:hypothetical protein n=1 Tax=Candidatus Igneacidithiobacillus taiwanensis TaxID=1945924 RepID=UPI002896B2F3|nr:hypothetical protein [Candidatus Igneacidithiobacillus taiwanensis]